MKRNILISIILLGSYLSIIAQNPSSKISNAEKEQIVDSVCKNLEREYIFPEITKNYVIKLRSNIKLKKYDKIVQSDIFATQLTEDLKAVSVDGHLWISYNPNWIKQKKQQELNDKEAILQKERRDRYLNYGFEEVKILPGNVGYLKLNSFSYNPEAYSVAIGTMNFLANTDALIIDITDNGGGSPEMVQLLCSYFFDNKRKHLNSFSYKDEDKLTQYWTYPYLPGKRLTDVELYVLTSQGSFSAAEEFSYDLQSMKRATIIGETTGGGAHDNKFVILNDNFMMSLPFSSAINPITKTNWEGIGVEPDIKTSSDKAFNTAWLMALEKLNKKEKDEQIKGANNWNIDGLKAKVNPIKIDEKTLKTYVGNYGPRNILFEEGELFYQRENRPKYKMIPINENYFYFDEIEYFRLRFIRKNSVIIGVEGLYIDGHVDSNLRTNK